MTIDNMSRLAKVQCVRILKELMGKGYDRECIEKE